MLIQNTRFFASVLAMILVFFVAVQNARAEGCGRLNVAENVTTVVVAGYQGMAISSLSAGDASETTTVIDIRVDLGRSEIFLMLDSLDPVIWRVSGHTERIVGVGIDGAAAGITGISAEKVQYFDSAFCELDLWKGSWSDSGRETKLLFETLGEVPDIVLVGYELGLVKVPRGDTPRAYRYPNARPPMATFEARQVERDMLRFNPGGVVDLDASMVVSNAEIAPYLVLPEEAGLAQLVESGALQPYGLRQYSPVDGWAQQGQVISIRTRAGRVMRLQGGDDLIMDDGESIRVVGGAVERSFIGDRTYIVRESIDIPPGLDGAHSVLFLMMEGLPAPRGDLSGSELRMFSMQQGLPAPHADLSVSEFREIDD